jgi:MFS family permease
VVSNILFAVGNLICGLATEEWMIILGRTVAGMGGGGLTAISTFLASDLVPLRKRGMWQGFGNLCFGLGSGLGGIFGGWMNDTWGWRWAFLLQLPFIFVSTIMVLIHVNVPVKETDTSRWKRIDFLGAGVLVVTLVMFLLGLSTGGNQLPWTHPFVLTTLSLSAVAFLGFLYVEDAVASEPVIPVRLLLDRTIFAACLTNWFTTMSVFAILIYMPLYLQVQGYSATMAGLRLVAQAAGAAVGSLGIGIIMRMTGRYLYISHAAVLLICVGVGFLCTFTLDTPAVPPFISLFVYGTGYGGMLTATLVALISAVDHEHQAVVTSASYAFRSTGSSIGITAASAVFQNLLKSGLWSRFGDRDGAADLIPKLRDSLDEIDRIPADWKSGVRDAYMDALRGVFWASLGLAVLGTLTNFAMREHKLHMNLQRK